MYRKILFHDPLIYTVKCEYPIHPANPCGSQLFRILHSFCSIKPVVQGGSDVTIRQKHYQKKLRKILENYRLSNFLNHYSWETFNFLTFSSFAFFIMFFQLSNYFGGLQARGDRPGPRHTGTVCQKMLENSKFSNLFTGNNWNTYNFILFQQFHFL